MKYDLYATETDGETTVYLERTTTEASPDNMYEGHDRTETVLSLSVSRESLEAIGRAVGVIARAARKVMGE